MVRSKISSPTRNSPNRFVTPRLLSPAWKLRANADLIEVSLRAFKSALKAADPRLLVGDALDLKNGVLRVRSTSIRLADYSRVFVIGGGKASGMMADELETILGPFITDGVVNVPDRQPPLPLRRIRLNPASHPIPSVEGVKGVDAMLKLTSSVTIRDLVFCLISGGGSALMPSPLPGLSREDKASATQLLIRSGATIDEINTVRKHLSNIKGGKLARRLYPAKVVSLIISDVVGDRLDTIASGPTVPDPTTFKEANSVLERYSLLDKVPKAVRLLIESGAAGRIEDTPKPGDKTFARVSNILVGNNEVALKAASRYLSSRWISPVMLQRKLTGEAKEVGTSLAKELLQISPTKKGRVAIVGGGETTVAVSGRGKGGRNQEMVLAAAIHLSGKSRATFAALATDGVDGPTDAAGASADGATLERAGRAGLDAFRALRDNDSNGFFTKLGDLIYTGPTGTGVNDIFIAIREY